MGTSLPVRLFPLIFIVLISTSCTQERETVFPQREIHTRVFPVDSFLTYIQHIYTGDSKFLYTGQEDSFISYSIIQFSYPDTIEIDSAFLTLEGDSISDTLYFYKVLNHWTEGHVLYDSLPDLKGDLFKQGYFTGDSITIKFDTLPENFDSNGVIIYSRELHRFSSSEGSNPPALTIFTGDTSYTYHPYRDAFLCDHPLVGDTIKDTILQGYGVGLVNLIYIPSDSIPLDHLYSRLEIGLFSPENCTLSVYYNDKLLNTSPAGDSTTFLSILPAIESMRSDSVDTLEYITFKIRMSTPFDRPSIFTLPAESLKVYIMFMEEEK